MILMTILKNITYGIFNTMVLVPGTVDTFKNQFFPPAFSKVMSLQNKTNRSGGGGVGGGGGASIVWQGAGRIYSRRKKRQKHRQKERGVQKNVGRRKTDRRQEAHIMYLDYNHRKY